MPESIQTFNWVIEGNTLQFTHIREDLRGDLYGENSITIDNNTSVESMIFPSVRFSEDNERLIIMLPGFNKALDNKKITLKPHQIQRVVNALEVARDKLLEKYL